MAVWRRESSTAMHTSTTSLLPDRSLEWAYSQDAGSVWGLGFGASYPFGRRLIVNPKYDARSLGRLVANWGSEICLLGRGERLKPLLSTARPTSTSANTASATSGRPCRTISALIVALLCCIIRPLNNLHSSSIITFDLLATHSTELHRSNADRTKPNRSDQKFASN